MAANNLPRERESDDAKKSLAAAAAPRDINREGARTDLHVRV